MAALNEVSEPFQLTSLDAVEWYFPSNSEWRVMVRFDNEILATYTEEEKELVYAEVGKAPSAILTLTLHWHSLDEARKAAKTLVEHLLGIFYGVADDHSGKDSIWRLDDIRHTKRGEEFPAKADEFFPW
jgi:hypothetical protein